MKIAPIDLIRYATIRQGDLVQTLSGKATFTVEVTDKGLNYTPTSTGKVRMQTSDYIKRICDRFSETQSFRKSDYAFTRHASYALALIRGYIDSGGVSVESTIPYRDMDQNIVTLVQAVNKFPGIRTCSSCGGHRNNTPNQLPWGQWEVSFSLEPDSEEPPSLEAWESLEIIGHGFQELFDAGSGSVEISIHCHDGVSFSLVGKDVDPDRAAEWLDEFRFETS